MCQRFYLKKVRNKCITRLFECLEMQIRSLCEGFVKGIKAKCFRLTACCRADVQKPNGGRGGPLLTDLPLLYLSLPSHSSTPSLSPSYFLSVLLFPLSSLSISYIFLHLCLELLRISQQKLRYLWREKKEKTSIINLEEP